MQLVTMAITTLVTMQTGYIYTQDLSCGLSKFNLKSSVERKNCIGFFNREILRLDTVCLICFKSEIKPICMVHRITIAIHKDKLPLPQEHRLY